MKTMTRMIGAVAMTAMGVLAGCSAHDGEASATSGDAIIGVTDLATLEGALTLVRDADAPMSDATLHAGDCYRALMTPGSRYQFRRYANGAAFFAKEGTGVDEGPQRPVVCVDVASGPASGVSYSGAALDALFRYDLGFVQRVERSAGSGEIWISTPRATVRLLDQAEEKRHAAVTKRPFEMPVGEAGTIGGRLLDLSLRDVRVSGGGESIPTGYATIDGATAMFVYRFAVRNAEEQEVHSLVSDRVGRFTNEVWSSHGSPDEGTDAIYFDGGIQVNTHWMLTSPIASLAIDMHHSEGSTKKYAECKGTTDPHPGAIASLECTGL